MAWLLTDDVVVQELVDLTGLGQLVELELGGLRQLLFDDLVAEVDALVADVDAGPAMSFLTCFWDLPQNEHLSSSPPSPNLAISLVPLFGLSGADRLRSGRCCPRSSVRDDLVDDAVLLGLGGGQHEVPVGVVV